jgi:hypothetical protein
MASCAPGNGGDATEDDAVMDAGKDTDDPGEGYALPLLAGTVFVRAPTPTEPDDDDETGTLAIEFL